MKAYAYAPYRRWKLTGMRRFLLCMVLKPGINNNYLQT